MNFFDEVGVRGVKGFTKYLINFNLFLEYVNESFDNCFKFQMKRFNVFKNLKIFNKDQRIKNTWQ
jgi:hypothetical protein